MTEIFEEISCEENFDVFYEDDLKDLELQMAELC